MAVKNLKEIMRHDIEFKRTFEAKMQRCYTEAAKASETGLDRLAVVKLAQAQVWEELLKAATP